MGIYERERAYWESRYGGGHPEPYGWEQFRDAITPAWEKGGSQGGYVHRRAYELLTEGGVEGRRILDYACGLGGLGTHLAQLGADVSGFDLSESGVQGARERAEFNKVQIRFDAADARKLPYEDESFDAVIGFSALEHTVKYEGSAEELLRVMKPGVWGFFTENLGENPLINFVRLFTMRHEGDAGDVLLTRSRIKEWASGFSEVRVEGYSFFFMAKKYLRHRPTLRVLHEIDRALFSLAPPLRRYGGECVIALRR